MTTDAHVEMLYGGDPTTFVVRRDGLVRELRATGRKVEAAAVKALRRPTAAAAALNAVARDDPDLITAVVDAADLLTRTQRRALSGLAGADVRGAVRAHHASIAAVIDAAGGQPVAVADAMRATLLAAAVDPQVAEDLRRGVLATTTAQADTSAALLLSAPLTAVAAQPPDGVAADSSGDDSSADDDPGDDDPGAGEDEAGGDRPPSGDPAQRQKDGEDEVRRAGARAGARRLAAEAKAARKAVATRRAAEEVVAVAERRVTAARAGQVATARKRRTAEATAEAAASDAAGADTTVARLCHELARAEAARTTAVAVQEEAEAILEAAVDRDDLAAQAVEQAQRAFETAEAALADLSDLAG